MQQSTAQNRLAQPFPYQDYALAQTQGLGISLPPLERDFQLVKGDTKPEAHFIGQIVGGSDFPSNDGLFCEMILQVGDQWEILSPPKLYQTQTCYSNLDKMFIWSHPIDVHFAVNDLTGWPKAIFRVWRLDSSNKMDTFSYGVLNFPKSAGFHVLDCETWSPLGDWKTSSMSFFMGTNPRLQSLDAISQSLDKREMLSTASSGKIIVELEVVLRNFGRLGISGQEEYMSRE